MTGMIWMRKGIRKTTEDNYELQITNYDAQRINNVPLNIQIIEPAIRHANS